MALKRGKEKHNNDDDNQSDDLQIAIGIGGGGRGNRYERTKNVYFINSPPLPPPPL